MIPSTHIKPIIVKSETDMKNFSGGGIEYKGKFYVSHEGDKTNSVNCVNEENISHRLRYNSEELWFIARLSGKIKMKDDKSLKHLAKLWATKSRFGCSYNASTEEILRESLKHIYCL